ncbi:probable NOT transcription complex subunit VIP2 isoform X2 [Dioscorea cayenensis subsp. rotundata]|uniref:Probable NOT transcription complex subunit VIP2 isoform X2 n=1 Tax=Dioscorea cayennensis subsp. rotundata TaxID=55577 RepID=A0AB40C9U1_DIOCR|nr:probable NOT transcription complex subunit VIP2 isoform X2 [Dioscorea cayenensis subsp. rotundata]
MSGLLNSTLGGSTSNLPDSTGRSFATSFSAQSANAPGFHHSGALQGLHNIHGGFSIPNMSASLTSLTSRNAAMNGVPSSGVQQPGGNISNGRFTSNNMPVPIPQMSHGSSHGHSGLTNRGGINVAGGPAFSSSMNGSIPGISSSPGTAGSRNSVPGLGISPIFGNVGPRITNSIGNIVGGNMGRSISSGGLSIPALASRVNLGANGGSVSLSVQGSNRFLGGMLQQAPQIIGMIGSSYPSSGGPFSQSQLQSGNNPFNSLGMLKDGNSNDTSPYDMSDFPLLSGQPNSAGGPQAQYGSLRKQGVGVSSIVQQNQEFSMQNEDFPALPGYKGGSAEFAIDLQQKEQLHENASMVQSPHFPMARSAGFNLGGSYSSNRQQQQPHSASVSTGSISFSPGNNQDLLHLHGTDMFPSSHGTYHTQVQNSGHHGIGLRPLGLPISSGMGDYEQILQQYQQQQNQSQLRLQQMSAASQSYRDKGLKSTQGAQANFDRFGLLGLTSVMSMSDPDLSSLALGIDLTTLGLNLSSNNSLYKAFASPFYDESTKGEPEYSIPNCYYSKQPPALMQGHFARFQLCTLFYIFYSMPKDEAQLYAANELSSRGWLYHKVHKIWFMKVPDKDLGKTLTDGRGPCRCFDPNSWAIVLKDDFVYSNDDIEKKPILLPAPYRH